MERYEFLNGFHHLDEVDYDLLQKKLKSKSFKKGAFLIVPGQVQKELYFVKSGIQMSFFDIANKSHVIAFTYSPGYCAIPDSFSFQAPSKCFLTCLTDSEFDYISFDDLEELYDQSQQIERLFRKMIESVLAGLISRHIELHALSIEERFKAFCNRSSHLLQIVPHKHIASYLGIDPTNFSKLYNSVKF